MLNLARSLLSNPTIRAKALQWSRIAAGAASAWVMTSTYVWITTHLAWVSQADAATVAGILAASASGLILAAVSIVYSNLDVNKVDAKLKATQAATAATVASAIQTGAVSPVKIVSQATDALSDGGAAHDTLAQTLASLRAGAA